MQCSISLLVFAVALGVVSGQACPNGYLDFSDEGSVAPMCIRFAEESKATWHVWRSRCQAEGADLAKVTGDLHGKIYNYIQNHLDMQDEAYWVGGSDMNSEGNWVWVADGTPIDMGTPHWDACTNQPDGGTAQNYLCLWTPRFYFSSCLNDVEIYAICQI